MPAASALLRTESADFYRQLAVTLRVGEEIPLEDLVAHLESIGYERREPVEMVGEFSLGLALVLGGCLEFAEGWASGRRGSAVAVGEILVVGGLLAAFWPKATLWTIAPIAGLSLVLHGIARLALAVMARAEIPGWGWHAAAGVVNILIGIAALVWPQATILVLSLVLGFQILIFGVILLLAAFFAGRTSRGAPAVP